MRFLGEFSLDGLSGSPGPIASRITGLRYVILDDPKPQQTIIETFTNQPLDTGNMIWCEIRSQLNDHISGLKLHDECILRVKRTLLVLRMSSRTQNHKD